ncbi:hypothetical protein [Granulosicoccus antarcticus]|uniref:Uncharacterized protein n=1 Tax=Granulosicoccus antarcticus IMCC3135 TaxID=1192854 RepID=A0A2Z2NSU8_9GAMM|nr:hypothetical protein [Granulosicoccus antarcticus]ASJ70244.1 hypothetical protein IMCC3135_00590 [Granulosicoccus antarcticus IMCC3135]
MRARRKAGTIYLLGLWVLISALAWPAYVFSSSLLAYLQGDGWQLDAWSQTPKRVMLEHFLNGYQQSLSITLPLGLIAVADYLLMSRKRISWWLAGISLPLTGALLALMLFQQAANALPTLVLTGLLLAIAYRFLDVLAGFTRRGRLR